MIVLFWWLVFRLEFGAGMIKIRGGREWRDLTALTYHHETQPMPGPLSRQAHLLPRWFHRVEVIGNHFAQLVVPWFLFAPILGLVVPGPVPAIVGAARHPSSSPPSCGSSLTGNFAWLNWATIVLAVLGDRAARRSARLGSGRCAGGSLAAGAGVDAGIRLGPWLVVTSAVGVLYLVISWPAGAQPRSRIVSS